MNDSGGNFADEAAEMVSEGTVNTSTELRKRRSTRIVQAVPLMATGVDALGRPFVERTSSLIINCHGCRYQSKHYVLKNMWVSMEIPHAESGQSPRTVRGRVAWIQRPRTVRQLFQVALELEVSGNVWDIAFPPEDWVAFAEVPQDSTKDEPAQQPQMPPSVDVETELSLGNAADNLRVFPSPASTTDASLQLARQVARLVADAKQQIQAATREAASQAVAAERRLSFEQWEQKFAAGRAEITSETAQATEKFRHDVDEHSQTAHAAAAEALRTELPKWLAPQLEQLTRNLTETLSREGAAQRTDQAQLLESTAETLRSVCREAEEMAARLKTQSEASEAQIVARAESAKQGLEEAAKRQEEVAIAEREALNATANETQQQVAATLATAQSSWHGQVASEMEAAQARWQETVESNLAAAQDRAAGGLNEHARGLLAQLQDEMARHSTAVRESAAGAAAESEQRITALQNALQEQSQQLESALARAGESDKQLEQHAAQLESTQQQALDQFRSQLDDVLSPRREEAQRRSEALLEEINASIRATFEDASRQAVAQFDRQIEELVQPHVTRTEEVIQRLAGGRSLFDAALAMHQERIRNSADEAFAESVARFRENLGGVEQILQESSQSITWRNLTELEGKAGDLKHQVVEELLKSAEWYEKKAQTQIQTLTDRTIEHAGNHLREKAGEISGVFASELDHASRSFVGHSQTQMEEIVRDAFERARSLFAEAADTTAAAFTDEIQRSGRQELEGFNAELQRSKEEVRSEMNAAREELAHRVTTEQQEFLRRFQAAMGGAFEAGLADARRKVEEGLEPILASWKSMTDAHQKEMERTYGHLGVQAAEQYKSRLENVSNQWLLATVASLDHQSRDMISGIAATAEEKLREACEQVFAGIGEALRERLKEMAQSFTPPVQPLGQAKSANTGA